MLDFTGNDQSAEPTPSTSYGRHYGVPISQIAKPKFKKTPAPSSDLRSRPVYLCPELGRTCHRPGAYDAFQLPSLFGDELKPHRFQD